MPQSLLPLIRTSIQLWDIHSVRIFKPHGCTEGLKLMLHGHSRLLPPRNLRSPGPYYPVSACPEYQTFCTGLAYLRDRYIQQQSLFV